MTKASRHRHHWRRHLPHLTLLLLPVTTPAPAETLSLTAPQTETGALALVTGRNSFRTVLVLRNPATTAAQVSIAVTETFRDKGGACAAPACTLGWTLQAPGVPARAIDPQQALPQTIAPGGFVNLVYGGALPAVDVYRSEVSVIGAAPVLRQ